MAMGSSAPHAGPNCRFIAPPFCPRLGIPFVYDPGPGMFVGWKAIADPPAYARARAAVRYDDVGAHAGACAEVPGPHRSGSRDGALDGSGAPGASVLAGGRYVLVPVAAALEARLEPAL